MRTSIAKVAERANVSTMTVSRVLRGRKDRFSDATYERVMEAVRELNYVPLQSSFQNRHVETRTIGLVPHHRSASRSLIDSVTYAGVCERAAEHGYDLFTLLRPEAEWMANREELRFLDRRSDGFIFFSPGVGEWQTSLEALLQQEIPAVVCYRRDVPEGIAWVDPDNESIVQQALDCLIRHGHSRIAYFGAPSPSVTDTDLLANLSGTRAMYDDRERSDHFTSLMRAAGHDEYSECLVSLAASQWPLAEAEAQSLFDSGATGVIVVNDLLALQLWDLAEAAGLRVPEDLSIVSVDDHIASVHRGLTSVAFGYDEVGRLAVDAWIDLKNGKDSAEASRLVPATLRERYSVAAPWRR